MVRTLLDLRSLASNLSDPTKTLLNENSVIYAWESMSKQIKINGYTGKKLDQYQDNGIIYEDTRNHFIFETVYDNNNPVDTFFPFFLIDRENPKSSFQSFLCFFNLQNFNTLYQEADDEQD